MKISKKAVLLAMSGIFTMASLGLMFVSASNGVIDLNVDPNNAIQHFESVKIISTGVNDDSYAVINKKGNLVGIETDYNFVLTSDGEDELINKISKTVSGSSILGGIGNKILGGIYNIILGGKENKIEKGSNSSILGGVANVEGNSKALSVIFGGSGNEIMGSYSSIIGGEGNKVTNGYATAIGSDDEANGYKSVAMGSGSKVSGKNSFLWSDGKDSNELLEHNVFAVKGENGMVVNTNKAHSLAQLTVSGSLVVYDDKKTLECTEDTKGVLRVINGDIYNNYQKCFCSCDGSGRNVLHEGTRCEAICNNGTGLQAECGSVKVNCDTNPYSYTGAGESGACVLGELVRGTGAFLVDTHNDDTEWIHRSCQTTYGQVTGCQQQLTGESCPNLRTGYECIRDHEELTGHLIMNPELPKDSATFWKYDPELSGPCTYMCDQYGEWDPIQGKCIFHECLGELPEGAKLNDEVALPMNDTTHYSYDAISTGACLYSCQKEYGYYYSGAVEKCLKCPDGQIYDEDSGICKVACDMSSTAFETITIMDDSGYAITIADRNLGAISNNIGEVSSYGCYFQWGNNYGFQPIGDIETSTEFVDTSSYGPGNPYTSEIFRVRTGVMSTGYGIPVYGPNDDDWSSPANDNLWGGANDSAINAFGVLDSDKENRQGPCPEGYHVPSIGERNDLLTMWYNKEYKTGGAEILQYIKDTQKIATFRGTGGAGLGGAESKRLVMAFRDYFRLPPAGSREFLDFAPGVTYGNGGSFWTSSSPWLSGSRSIGSQVTDARIRLYPNNANSFDYNITREGYVGHGISGRKMIAQSVRCFKDVPECPSGSIWNQSELKCETITDCDMEHMAIQDLELFFIGGSGDISHYMMMDRNLGAFEVYNQKGESNQNARSLGCHFQWGNNYGFHLGTPITRYGINPMSYGPGNYYSKNRFWCYSGSTYDGELLEDEPEDEGNSIYGSMYSPYNYHMWGGGYIDGYNNYIKGTSGGTDIDRQGPCPAGYHVPGGVEMKELVNNRNNASISQGAVGKNFASDLLMPYGRYIEVYCGEQNKLKKGGGIWLSDKVYYRKQGAQHGTYANHLMKFTDTSDIGFGNNGYAHGFPVRCVKNEMANTPQKVTIHVDGGTGAVIAIDWETEGSGKITALSSPTKNGIDFLGWYSSLSFAPETKLNTGDYVSSGGHIYARWDGCNIADTAVQNLEVFFLLTPTRISHYMMMDRNLGATEAFNQDISSPNESSYGCYFQWGNNYPFNGGRNGSPSTTGTLTDTENYGPGRSKGYYYNSARYCVGGGGTGMYPYADRAGGIPLATRFWGGGWFDRYGEMYSGSIDGTDIDRQGPCPTGYHIPRGKEMENIMNDWKDVSNYNQSDSQSVKLEKSKIMASDLLLPFAGWNGESCENKNHYLGKGMFGKYLISDYYKFEKNHLHIGETSDPDGIFLKGNGPAYGFSMRCVKNNISDTPQKVTIDADGGTGAVIAIDWESAENGKIVTLGEPRKNGYDFGGWYTNQSFTTSVNVGDGISNGGSLYAKWIARDCDVENTTVQDLEVYFLSNTGNITHYTMMDRNLGAMEVYNQNPSLQNEESFGCYFQWGNNYGFNKGRNGSSYTTETLTDTKSYGPGSQSGYYYNSKRYCNLPGSGDNMYPKDGSGYPFATRLWGGGYRYEDGTYRNDGWGSWGSDGSDIDRQGPCPEGYHIPRGTEMDSIIKEWKDVADYPKTQSEYSSSIGLQKSKQLASDLMLPLAGGNQTECSGTLYTNSNYGSYIIGDYYKRTNPITSTYMPTNHLHIGSSAAGNGIYFYLNGPAHGKSMRCVKNNISANPKITIHPNGGTGAVIVIDWETEGSGKIMTLGEPSKLGYSFEGWYSDESFTNRISTGDYISNSGYLYAKWNELIAIFMKGTDFRNELINLARLQNIYESGENIEGFKRVNIIPSGVTTGLVSDVSSGAPIWAWYYSGVIYYYTEANKIYLNEDSSDMFGDLTNLVSIDMDDWNTSNVTNMRGIFSGCNSLTGLNLSSWDTKNVNNMSFMFSNCSNLIDLNLSGWNTSKVTNMRGMFDYCSGLTSLDVGSWDTSNVTNMSLMFRYCSNLTDLDVSKWNTSKVINMAGMFNQCRSLTSIGVSEWNTSNVTNMMDIFNHCVSVTGLDLSKWNTSKVTTMYDMFTDCLELEKLDISNFDTSNVTTMGMMFQTCPKLESLDLSHFNTSKVTSMRSMFGGSSSLKEINLSNWDTSKVTDMRWMFRSCHSLTSLDLRHFDTSNVTGMDMMFSSTFALTDLDLSSFDTSKVVSMSGMFSGCYNLKTIYASTSFVTDNVTDDTSSMFMDDNELVGGFGTKYSSSHTDKEYAKIDSESQSGYFTLLKISTLLPGTNFKNTLTSLAGNETNITKIIQYTGNTIPSGVTTGLLSTNDSAYPVYAWYNNGTIYYYTNADIIYLNSDSSSMFYNMKGLAELDMSNFNTSKVTDMSSMFANCSGLTNLNLSGRNTSKVTSMQKMFYNCQSLIELDVSNWDTSSVIDMESMFLDCISLENLDVSNWNTSNVTNMESMFQSCITLKTLDVSKRKTDNVTNMKFMFGGKSYNVMNLENLDVSNWNTSNVTNMEAMFQNCENLTGLDVSGWETDNLTTMNHMFFNCGKLTNLDVSKWNTSNVTDMSSVFYECVNLTGLDVSNWDTSKVTDMKFMFAAGSGVDMKFEYLDVSNWNTSNVTSMHCMFQSCGSLTKLDVSNWNTSNVTDMDHMFHGCENLTKLDVSNWNTSNVINMYDMFLDCKRLTKLDVGNWDTSKVTDMSFMFYGCTNLVTIYANLGFVTNQVTGSVNMFAGDRKLVGGFGTTFNSSKINKEYARIDNESQSGYFTLLKASTLLSGKMFNQMIKRLAGQDNATYGTYNTTITQIVQWTGSIIPSGVTTGLISTNDSAYPIYAWFNNSGIIYYYTEANKIYLNPDSSYTFYRMSGLTELNLNNFDTSNVVDMSVMFSNCSNLTNLDLSSFDTSDVVDMSYMFYGCTNLTNLDLSSFDTSDVVDMRYMFYGCTNLTSLDLNSFDTSDVVDMRYMFYDCVNLTGLNLSSFDTSNVINMSSMFGYCSGLIELDLSNFNTSNVADMGSMFRGCGSLTKIDLSNFDTSNVTNMHDMFNWCINLKELDISSFDTSKVTRMSQMFQNCNNLTKLDLSNFDTSNVTTMQHMFTSCHSLKDLDISSFNTSNVTDMSTMFSSTQSLTGIDLTNFDTSSVTNMRGMFAYCISLKELNLSNFDTSNVTNMGEMFKRCESLTGLNLNNFQTNKLGQAYGMFSGAYNLRMVDLSSFDTSNIENMSSMFMDCRNLKTIYTSSSFVTSGLKAGDQYHSDMFLGDTKLVGGNGTTYNSSYVDKIYARIDQPGTPGYFTLKQ